MDYGADSSDNSKRTKLEQKGDGIVHTPLSLFTSCVTFVASHLSLVESFYGLPEIIAKEIFECAKDLKNFEITRRDALHLMQMFTEIYEELVLASLNISNHHLCLNFALEKFQIFKHLSELDVSSCALGDDHEYLACVGHMTRLSRLNLSNNSLSDKGLQRITAPHRVFKRGPVNLQVLDVSDNADVTSHGILYFSCFCRLQVIDITATGVKSCAKMGIYWKFKPTKTSKLTDIQTSGWAEDVINGWIKFARQNINKLDQLMPKTKRFYSKRKDVSICKLKSEPSIGYVKGFRLLLQKICENSHDHPDIVTSAALNSTGKSHDHSDIVTSAVLNSTGKSHDHSDIATSAALNSTGKSHVHSDIVTSAALNSTGKSHVHSDIVTSAALNSTGKSNVHSDIATSAALNSTGKSHDLSDIVTSAALNSTGKSHVHSYIATSAALNSTGKSHDLSDIITSAALNSTGKSHVHSDIATGAALNSTGKSDGHSDIVTSAALNSTGKSHDHSDIVTSAAVNSGGQKCFEKDLILSYLPYLRHKSDIAEPDIFSKV